MTITKERALIEYPRQQRLMEEIEKECSKDYTFSAAVIETALQKLNHIFLIEIAQNATSIEAEEIISYSRTMTDNLQRIEHKFNTILKRNEKCV